ncbi:MAG: hypothetical protein AAF335_05045, partial [Bacteroidota bacterium]
LGFLGLFSFGHEEDNNPKYFYKISYYLYSSKTIMPLATTIALFSSFQDPLYKGLFWLVYILFFLLAWFPKMTIVFLTIAFAYVHYQSP